MWRNDLRFLAFLTHLAGVVLAVAALSAALIIVRFTAG